MLEPRTTNEKKAARLGTHRATVDDRLLAFGDLTGDGLPEAVLIDINETNRMEVLSLGDLDNPLQTLQFPIFEADPHFQGRRGRERNARQILIEDLTGDGRKDVVLLIHDRVLIYPQAELSGSP